MAEPTSFPNAAETKVVPDAPSKLDEMIASYLQPGDAVTDPQIDRSLANIAAEAKPASTPPVSPAATLEPKAESHPGSLLTWAQKLGISKEEVDSTPTAELWDTVKSLHQLSGLHGDQTQRQPAVTPEAKPEPAKGEIDFGPKGDELFDADVKAALTHALKPIMAELAELRAMKEELGGVKQHLVNQAASAHHNAIDSFFSKLPPELQAVFGAGSRVDLDPKSPEIRRRRAAILDAQGTPGDFWKNLDTSARTMFGGVAPASVPAAAEQPRNRMGEFVKKTTSDEWADSTLATPTNRKSPPEPKGEDRAAKAIHDLVKSSGRSVNGNARLEDFPD